MEQVNVTSPEKQESEDASIVHEHAGVFGVLDGATPLSGFQNQDGHNGAYLAAQLFKNHFQRLSVGAELVKEVTKANDKLRSEMLDHKINIDIGYERWSTCVAVVRISEQELEFAQLGDSMIMVGYVDGTSKLLTRDTVEGISERAKLKRNKDRELGRKVQAEEHFEDPLNQLRFNRSMANIANGYSVANGMKNVEEYIQAGKLALRDIQYVFIFSDGLFHPELNLDETYRQVRDFGLMNYIQKVTEVQQDKSLRVDDRTAIWITF
ncbi:hypothetical protein LD39_02545 [Halobacillus sp. BBL2006]|nr:hypothetical protein LD39_02545 [Halobacillus sp. BBL2006]